MDALLNIIPFDRKDTDAGISFIMILFSEEGIAYYTFTLILRIDFSLLIIKVSPTRVILWCNREKMKENEKAYMLLSHLYYINSRISKWSIEKESSRLSDHSNLHSYLIPISVQIFVCATICVNWKQEFIIISKKSLLDKDIRCCYKKMHKIICSSMPDRNFC